MKKKLLGLLLVLAVFSVNTFSQLEEKIKNENVVAGSIKKGGQDIQGYFKRTGLASENGKVFPAPWEFQTEMKFIAKDVFENTEKIKNKLYESYTAKDIDGFKYDTLIYESLKYADMSAVGMGMIAKKMFLRKVMDGKITIYHHFGTPPSIVGSEGFEPYYIECGNPNIVYQIGKEGKLKLVNSLNVEKELADCPYVVEKDKKGEYKVLGKEGEETKGLKKLANKTVFRDAIKLMIIEDYNKNCK
jgi:hypothetical protein